MKICLVANYEDTSIDHSAFIDSCDIVMRVNRMTNYNSGHCGSKTTHVWIHNILWYFRTVEPSILDYLKENKPKLIIGLNQKAEAPLSRFFDLEVEYETDKFLPNESKVTSVVLAYMYLRRNFPDEKVYFFGDVSRVIK